MKNLGIITRELDPGAIESMVQSASPILGRQPDTVSVDGTLYAVWQDGPERFGCGRLGTLGKGLHHKTAKEIAQFLHEVIRGHYPANPIKIRITAKTKPERIFRIVRSAPVGLGNAAQLLEISGKQYRLWRSRTDHRFYCEQLPAKGRRGQLRIAETAAEMSKMIGVIADAHENPHP